MEQRWFVVHTFPKHEKKVSDILTSLGVEAFLPLQSVWRQWSDRRKKITVPLFPNYLFVLLPKTELNKVLNIPGVIRYLSCGGEPSEIPLNDIQFIKTATSHDFELCSHLVKGDDIQIIDGPFRGLIGVLQWTAGKKRIAVLIKVISKVIIIEAEPYQIVNLSKALVA